MRIKLDEHEYRVKIPASALPALTIISRAIAGEQVSDEDIDRAEEKIISKCVTPPPCDEHREIILFHVLRKYAMMAREVAAIFRE